MMLKKIILFVLVVAAISCSSSDDSNGSNDNDGFNRTELLTNIADNIIVPTFQDLQTQLSALEVARSNFNNDKTSANLEALSDAWLEAYKVWQHVQIYNLGEADNLGGGEFGFVSYFNIYPVTVADIETAANTGLYDLNSEDYFAAQGFPALDFLIHGIATDDALPIEKFTTNSDANGFDAYLTAVISQMTTLNDAILNNWVSSYRATFIANTDSGLNGSINKLANDLIFSYEYDLRAKKFGIPAGIFSNGGTLPSNVEALYKRDVSKELALEALTAIDNLFNGTAYNGSASGASFNSYLEFLDRADLVTEINNQFAAVENAIDGLDNDFYQQITDNNVQMLAAYEILQAAVPKLKIDMVQALSIVIDFNDSDGD